MKKDPKQATLDNLPDVRPKDALEILKRPPEQPINITQIETTTKEDELSVKITFKLPPDKAFSKVQSEIYFDRELVCTALIKMLQGPLATEESEFSAVLDMRGVAAGQHIIGVEMYGLWSSGEKLSRTIREVTIDYVPQTRQDRLVKIPILRSVAGADLAVVSNAQRSLYEDIEKTLKREQSSQRDEW